MLILNLYHAARAAGELTVEILAGYNLVVDSNVTATSTFGPEIATVAAKVCNTLSTPIDGVELMIGNYLDGTNDTPGVYPARNSAGFPISDPLYNTGVYSFGHIGGSTGVSDATRFIGTLAGGQCSVQYWHISYPRCSNNQTPPCSGTPVWGASNDPADDLWLDFDVWASSNPGYADNKTWTMTMRNEISAMANKIEPNPDGIWFNTASDVILPGETITSNGINYELGLINQGFDNDGDYIPDYNAWLQPVGDAAYDPSCFRLIHTSGVITATRSSGRPDLVIPFEDQLYFTDLPSDNTGVTGKVFYTFLALDGPCSTALSPYQEVASGYDNEKFNSDYGTGIPPLGSYAPAVSLDKTTSPDWVALGGTFTYQLPFQNIGAADAGLTFSSGGVYMPLVLEDTVPAGLQYVGGSASASLAFTPNSGYTMRFSTDSGATWSTTDPGTVTSISPSGLVKIQWWLKDPLPAGSSGSYAAFQARVPLTYTGSPFIENCARASFGAGAPLDEACISNYVRGINSLGNYVWLDSNLNGYPDGELPLANVTVSLYWDKNGNRELDSGDLFMGDTSSDASGIYLFTQLPDGNYIVQVDTSDPDLPAGVFPTTNSTYAADLDSAGVSAVSVVNLDLDFGFGPTLKVSKSQTSPNPAYEGEMVTYRIDLTNQRPGNGSGQPTYCTYTVWAGTLDTVHSGTTGSNSWQLPANAINAAGPDGVYAHSPYDNATNRLAGTGFNIGTHGNITSVEAIFSIYVGGTLVNDDADAYLYFNSTQLNNPIARVDFTSAQLNAFSGQANQGLLVWNVTAARTWTWGDIRGNLDLRFDTVRNAGLDNVTVYLDGLGFRITTDELCGDSDDTIAYLPLSDTYDPTKLQFVSADPQESSVSNGVITWDDLAPLYAGQTRTVTVTFKALEPPDSDSPADGEADPTTHLNCASVSSAEMGDGSPTNDYNSCVTTNINPTGAIGDTVWNDNGGPGGSGTSGNGLQDGDEQGISGVTVYLCTALPCTGANAIASRVTDANGYYLFEGLRDGTYYVAVDTPSLPGSSFTQTGDPDATLDNRGTAVINNNNGSSANDNNYSMDFGYLVPNSLLGSIWQDHDGDGVLDDGDNGIAGITVYLDDCGANAQCGDGDDGVTRSTTTSLSGYYAFSDLPNSNYRVRVNTTSLPAGGTWSNTFDPEGDNNSQSDVIFLAGGNTFGSFDYDDGPYDFAYHRSGAASIGDTLYRDWDGDGTQDAAEEGIPSVTVYLYEDADGDGAVDPGVDALVAATTTAANGSYLFSSLPPGNFIVVVDESDPDLPGAYVQTQDPDEGGVCSVCNGRSSVTVVVGVDSYLNEDFGYRPYGYGSIGDFVWRDTDADGVQDSGEAGIASITVRLYADIDGDGVYDAGTDALVASTVTDAGGAYRFSSLPAGNYLVDVDTMDADLPLDGNGARYVLSTGNDPHAVALAAGQAYDLADFGFTPGGVIGDYVWQDNDGDGFQDLGEPGIAGASVRLYLDVDGNGVYTPGTDTQVGSTFTTGADGRYQFTSLPAGDYVVVVSGLGAYTQTYDPDASGVPCSGGECDSQAGLGLSPGQVDRSIDFGFQPRGNLGDTLWIDADGDGLRAAGESGIANVTVTLYNDINGNGIYDAGTDTLVGSTSTDLDGYYSFGNLPDGSYVLVVNGADPDFPGGLVQSYDPDGNLNNQCPGLVSGGSSDLTRDFGYRYSGAYSISGTAYHDTNDSGTQDPTETTTYQGVTVYLWNSSGRLIGTTQTDASGNYTFGDLPNGSYVVSVNPDAPNLEGMQPTQTSSPVTYRLVTISGADVPDQDFGFLSSLDLGDLPAAYNLTTLFYDGARHRIPTDPGERIYLGAAAPDSEPDGQPNAIATGDGSDEDGVAPSTGSFWSVADGGSVQVTVSGCPDICYLSAWVDWSGTTDGVDFSFSQPGDRILLDYPVSNGTQTVTFSIPAGTVFQNTFDVRFRLYPNSTGGYATPSGLVYNGEVEDFQWTFGPTAVTLSGLSVSSGGSGAMVALAALLVLLVLGASMIQRLRREARS